ncbi:MAG: hypothetical protein RL138_525 [Bacteroidota bacterium]
MNAAHTWWKKLPLLRPLVIFGGGILAARHWAAHGFTPVWVLFGVAVVFQTGLLLYERYRPIPYAKEYLKQIAFIIALFAFSWCYALLRNPRVAPNHVKHFSIRHSVPIEARIVDIKKRPGKADRLSLELLKARETLVSGLFWCYETDSCLQKGMRIQLWGNMNLFASKGLLKDWEEQAMQRGIDGIIIRSKTKQKKIAVLEQADKISSAFYFCQMQISRSFQQSLPDTMATFATALCIGEKDGLSKFLQADYTACGLSHILAVSGMHLGLVVLALQYILFFLSHSPRVKTILLILFIWIFSILSGGSAAVMRAALMYSISLAAPLFYRKGKAENGLVASLFILLLIDPYYLFDVGFQLSYAAILSILWIYPKLRDLLIVKNKILLALWNLVCISLAAQLLTAPLCLFYFKQFPNYFLLANVWAIPLSTVVLYALLLLVLVHPFTYLSGLLSWLCIFLVKLLNQGIHWLAHCKGAVSYFPNFDGMHALTLLLSVFLFLRLLEKQNAARIIQTAFALLSLLI